MANVTLPTFPALAAGALFVKGIANGGTAATAAQYVTFGHCFQIGQLPAGSGLSANFGFGAVPCQADVKTSYQDGSAAHALITVQAPSVAAAATLWGQFSATTPLSGTPLSLASALSGRSLVLTVAATTPAQTFTVDLVAALNAAAFNPWLNGPLAVQARAIEVIYQGLRVVIDLTAFADGTIDADVMLANDIAMLAAAGTMNYTATLTLDGTVAYTSPALTHYQYQNWTAEVGTVPGGVRVIHDPNDFIAAQAVQPYTTTLGVASSNQSLAQEFMASSLFGQPLTNPLAGSSTLVDEVMGGEGGRTDIGANDAWSTWAFITQDPIFWAVGIEAAKVNGAIPWHLWNQTTQDYYTCEDIVNFWPASTSTEGVVPLTQAVPSAGGWQIDQAHFPELVYLVYLQTGRRYYLDELNATTRAVILWQWPPDRGGNLPGQVKGPLPSTTGLVVPSGQIRGGAWGLRNILYSTYASPDGSARKTYARQMLGNNYNWLNEQTAAWTTWEGETAGWVPINICSGYGNGEDMPPWQQDYFFSSVSLAAMMGYQPAQQFAGWMTNFIVNRFSTTISGWAPQDGIAYNWILFPNGFSTSPPPQTWAEIESMLVAAGRSQTTSPIWTHQAGDYGQLALIALNDAETIGLAGAAAAITWVEGSGMPAIDPVSWAQGPLVQTVARTLNGSQVFAAAAPPSDAVKGTVVLGALLASGALTAGSDVLSGVAHLGSLVASGSATMPTYLELAAYLASAISDLDSVLAELEQWEATLAAEAKSASKGEAAALLRWQGTIAAEVTAIEAALTELP